MAELRDSRRCAIAAATVVLVGAAPLAAHAARPSPGSREDASSAATRRLIDAELGELGGTVAPAVAPIAATAPSDADGLPASPARALLVAQQTVPAATPPQPMPAPAPEMAPASPPEETLPPSPTVILPPEVPAAQPSAPTAQPQAPAAAVPSGPASQGPAPGALAPLPVAPATSGAEAAGPPQPTPTAPMPTERDAYRAEALRESREGAATLALDHLREHSDWFTDNESWHVEHAAAAQRIRWGREQLKSLRGPERFVIIDQGVAEIEALLKKVPETPENAALRQEIVADEVVALASRGRMKDATQRYEAMSQAGKVPAYTRVSAGDAYAYLDKPDRAAAAYTQALKDAGPGEIETGDVQEGLFYADLDTGRYEDARALLDKMKADNPEYVRLAPEAGTPNPDYSRVKRLEAQYLVLTGHTHEGIAALDTWRHEAPFAASFVSARADGAMVQAEPYTARTLYKTTLSEHPDDLSVMSGYGRASLALDDLKTAKDVADGLDERFPENGSVHALRKDLDVYQSPQLIIQAAGDKGNAVFADQEFGIDTKAYSGAFADHYRLCAQLHRPRGFPGRVAEPRAQRRRRAVVRHRHRGERRGAPVGRRGRQDRRHARRGLDAVRPLEGLRPGHQR